jgi:hypothetical protein
MFSMESDYSELLRRPNWLILPSPEAQPAPRVHSSIVPASVKPIKITPNLGSNPLISTVCHRYQSRFFSGLRPAASLVLLARSSQSLHLIIPPRVFKCANNSGGYY